LNEETAFLSAIRQLPADDTTRLVYADWLDEQGDPHCASKAEFLRLELRMATDPEKGLNRVRWLTKLRKLAAAMTPGWLAIVSHPKLEACRFSFQFECPKQWEKLTPTEAQKVRFCDNCKKQVHYCETIAEARGHAAQGHCVAVALALVRRPDDLIPPRPPGLVGAIRLTPEMIERLGRPDLTVIGTTVDPGPPSVQQLRPEWVPQAPARPRRPGRKRRRKERRNRNIQRENWEEQE
jgi:uncharacterized protein (TIGR02996 family)